MKSDYTGGVMLCFVQSFEGQQTPAKEPNNNEVRRRKRLQLAADSESARDEAIDLLGDLKDPKAIEAKISRRMPEVKRSFSDRFIVGGDAGGKKIVKIRKTRSSGNFAALPSSGAPGGVSARSAPSTPLQELHAGPPGSGATAPAAAPSAQAHQASPHRRSPHHHHPHNKERMAVSKSWMEQSEDTTSSSGSSRLEDEAYDDRSGIKHLSQSAPSVSVNGAPATGAAPPAPSDEGAGAGARKAPSQPSKARQKKFLRHFPQVPGDERVLNYYSCALVGDILLQGHLYITKNYFAFYSNVFGYVTKLLIPTASVLRVSKEKMARIIPNAVGVVTVDERHVFGSLLSRDSTYRLMLQVWKEAAALHSATPIQGQELRVSEVDLDMSEYSMDEDSSSGGEGPPGTMLGVQGDPIRPNGDGISQGGQASITSDLRRRKAAGVEAVLLRKSSAARNSPHPNSSGALGRIAAAGAATLLALLAVMAGLLIWRLLNHPPGPSYSGLEERLQMLSREDMYTEILRWQSQLHRKSANEVNDFLETNLDQIAKVRLSLEALSALMVTDRKDKSQQPEELPSPTDNTDHRKIGLENVNS